MTQPATRSACGRIAAVAAVLVASAVLLGGCAAPAAERHYRLELPPLAAGEAAAAAGGGTFAGDLRLVIGSIPDSLDRPQLVVRRGPNEVRVLEDERWAEPLRAALERVLRQSAARALPAAWVHTDGPPRGEAGVIVMVDIEELGADTDGRAVLQARWLVAPRNGAPARGNHLDLAQPTRGPGVAAVVATWSEQVDALGRAIAASLARDSAGR